MWYNGGLILLVDDRWRWQTKSSSFNVNFVWQRSRQHRTISNVLLHSLSAPTIIKNRNHFRPSNKQDWRPKLAGRHCLGRLIWHRSLEQWGWWALWYFPRRNGTQRQPSVQIFCTHASCFRADRLTSAFIRRCWTKFKQFTIYVIKVSDHHENSCIYFSRTVRTKNNGLISGHLLGATCIRGKSNNGVICATSWKTSRKEESFRR